VCLGVQITKVHYMRSNGSFDQTEEISVIIKSWQSLQGLQNWFEMRNWKIRSKKFACSLYSIATGGILGPQ